MTELVDWLKQQLDEDERAARDVARLRASWHTGGGWQETGSTKVLGEDDYVIVEDDTDWAAEIVEHIARWDPARVLAEVEAKRRILDAHGRPHECIELTGSGDHSVVDGQPWELWELAHTADHGPCFVVRTLSQPYAGRDGWHEEWAA